jgi:hypothetical protein
MMSELAAELRKVVVRLEQYQPSGPLREVSENGKFQRTTHAGSFAYLLTMLGKIADKMEQDHE